MKMGKNNHENHEKLLKNWWEAWATYQFKGPREKISEGLKFMYGYTTRNDTSAVGTSARSEWYKILIL